MADYITYEPNGDEVVNKISDVFGSPDPNTNDLVSAIENYEKYFKYHQEQPKLLFKDLDVLFHVINKCLSSNPSLRTVKALYQLINIAYSTIGIKQMMMHLPHEIADFCLYITIIQRFSIIDKIKSSSVGSTYERNFDDSEISFSIISGILLQLCASVVIPFCLDKVYPGSKEIISSLIKALLQLKMQNSVCFDLLPYLFALYNRHSDTRNEEINDFLVTIIKSINLNPQHLQLQCLACFFNTPSTKDIDRALYVYQNTHFEKICSPRVQKMHFKLTYRIAVCLLCNEAPRKRYKETLVKDLSSNLRSTDIEEDINKNVVTKEIEGCILTILTGLSSKTAESRYTCSKGLARIMERLPDDVISQILLNINLQYRETDNIEFKQGICLLYGELARKGLIYPSEIPNILVNLKDAITLENRQVSARDGTYVRDAACYVFWAFSRAFLPKDYSQHALDLTAQVVNTAVFDRESMCRRAASAALQECVGRTGVVPHGIELTVILDFINISNLERCLTKLVPEIYKIAEYQDTVINHLITHCLGHWDIDYRLLATQGLANCAKSNPSHFFKSSIQRLFEINILTPPAKIHGFMLSFSKVARDCSVEVFNVCNSEVILQMLAMVDQVKKKKTTTANLLNSAKFSLFASLIEAKLDENNLNFVIYLVNSHLKEIHDCHIKRDLKILNSVEEFFAALAKRSSDVPEFMSVLKRYLAEFYIKALHDFKRITISLLRVLKHVPTAIIKENFAKISFVLFDSEFMSNYNARRDLIYNDILAESISAYARIICSFVKEGYLDDPTIVVNFYTRLIDLSEFYHLSSSGEIGAGVRSTSLKCLYKILKTLVQSGKLGDELSIERCLGSFIRQTAERNLTLRATARNYFCKLLMLKIVNKIMADLNVVISGINIDEWKSNLACFSVNVAMISTKFCLPALLGIICYLTSCDSMVSTTKEALTVVSMINESLKISNCAENFCDSLIEILNRFDTDKRMALAIYVSITAFYKMEFFLKNGSRLEEISRKTVLFIDKVSSLMSSVIRFEQRIDILCDCINIGKSEKFLFECAFRIAKLLNHAYYDVRKYAAAKLISNVISETRILRLLNDNAEHLKQSLIETDWENNTDDQGNFEKKFHDIYDQL